MQIGEVIRKYRKEKNMTQEEMAKRLGVSTPAVNKWENGNSMPDIALLAPIARLLEISLDTLLSYQESLSSEEINDRIQRLNELLKNDSYEKAFQWAEHELKMYPNAEMLRWQMAVVLDAHRLMKVVPDSEKYDAAILRWYQIVLESQDEMIRNGAADSLFGYYYRKEDYEKAEEYLKYLTEQNPERKRKQAAVYAKTGRRQKAYKSYEELLFSGYQMISMVLNGIYILALEDGNIDKARKMVEKQSELARLFEMGKYHEISCWLELAILEQDEEWVQKLQKEMLDSIDEITKFTKSSLYEHMSFKEASSDFLKEMKNNLTESFENAAD